MDWMIEHREEEVARMLRKVRRAETDLAKARRSLGWADQVTEFRDRYDESKHRSETIKKADRVRTLETRLTVRLRWLCERAHELEAAKAA